MSTNNNNNHNNHKTNNTLLSTSISSQLADNSDKTRSTVCEFAYFRIEF